MRDGVCTVEMLEKRRLLAAAASPTWQIAGSPEADTISVELDPVNHNRIVAMVDGQITTRSRDSINQIIVNAGDGDDTVTIDLPHHAGLRIVGNGGAGNDSITGGSEHDHLYGDDGDDMLIGGGGRDTLVGGNGEDTLNPDGKFHHAVIYADSVDSVVSGPGEIMRVDKSSNNQPDPIVTSPSDPVTGPTQPDPITVPPNQPVGTLPVDPISILPGPIQWPISWPISIDPTTTWTPNPNPTPQSSTAFADSVNDFAADFYSKLRTEQPDQNIFFSAYSIVSAFAMVYIGANGETRQQMANVLHLPADTQELLNNIAADQSFSPAAGSGATVSQGNGVWVSPKLTLNSDYLADIQSAFGAGVQQADFTDPNTVNVINNWVAAHTDGKIQNLFSTLDPNTLMALVNAVYFKSDWQNSFEPYLDTQLPFTDDTGSSSTATFMNQTRDYQYYQNDDLQMIELPYTDNDYEMTIVLPSNTGGLASIDSMLTPANLATWSSQATSTDIELSLPTFTLQTNCDLTPLLSAMGMGDAFSNSADFSGITTSVQLQVNQSVHKAYLKVDEQGTEAAAATGIGMTDSAVVYEPPPIVFNANHPFYIAINDVKTSATLFSGAIINPGNS